MSADLYDDDARDPAEIFAAEWAAYRWAIARHLHQLREHVVAVAVARLYPTDDRPAMQAVTDYLSALDEDMREEVLRQVLWKGCRSAEREARTRLMRLRNAKDVTQVLEEINRG